MKKERRPQPKFNQMTGTQRVGFEFLVQQELDAKKATHEFLKGCMRELGLDPTIEYTITDQFEFIPKAKP